MKRYARYLSLVCLLSGVAFGGGKQKPQPKTDAEKYAAALSEYLTRIDAQVAKKREAETNYYTAVANVYVVHYVDEVLESLVLERRERGGALADEAVAGRARVSLTFLRRQMLDQARSDVAGLRRFPDDERAIRNAYLSSLASLDGSAAKIQALAAALDKLAEPKSAWGDVKDLGDFGVQVKSTYTTLKCADNKKEIDQLTAQKGQLASLPNPTDAQKAELKSIGDQLTNDQKYADVNCKDSASAGGGNP